MNKKFRNKIDLAHHYTLVFAESDAFALKVETEDDVLYFDGKDGDVVIESEPFSDEPYISTVDEMVDNFGEMLQDWGVDFDTAQAICIDLTPWFQRYAISNEDAISNEIAELETRIKCRRKGILDRCGWINEEKEQIAKRISESNTRIAQREAEIHDLNEDIEVITKQIAELKARLK